MNIKLIYLLSTLVGIFALISNVNAKYEDVPSSILKKYLPHIDCVLDREPCDFIGNQVKKLLPNWFKNECADCDFFIKSEAKKKIPDIQKYFAEDWQLIEQKYGGKSAVQKVHPKFSTPSKPSVSDEEQKVRPKFSQPSKPIIQDFFSTPSKPSVSDEEQKVRPKFSQPSKPIIQDFFSTPSKPSVSDEEQKVRPKFSQPSKPIIQNYQTEKILSVSDKSTSVEDLFANDESFGAKAVLCLVMKKGCDKRMKLFKRSMFLFTMTNTCPGCENPKVHVYFTQAKKLLEKSFPEILQDIIVNRGE